MNFISTGKFATDEQLKQVTAAFDLDYRTPVMAVLPNGKVTAAPEDFRDMARRFAREAGLPDGDYGIEPNTREFQLIEPSVRLETDDELAKGLKVLNPAYPPPGKHNPSDMRRYTKPSPAGVIKGKSNDR